MHRIGWLIGALIVSGCTYDPFDPYARPGTWVPEGVNDANLRMMVARPDDLVAGTGESTSAGAAAAAPVARVLAGKRYPLPAQSASPINVVTSPQPQGSTNPGTAE